MSETRNQRFTRRRIVLISAFVVVAFIAGAIAWRAYMRPPPGYATGDPLDVELVGVWASDGLDVYDAAGKQIGETLGTPYWLEEPSEDYLRRTFIFRSGGGVRDVTFSPGTRICPTGANRSAGTASDRLYQGYGDNGFCVGFMVPSEYSVSPFARLPFLQDLFSHDAPTGQVDVTLFFWQGPRGPAEHAFIGPFAPGKMITVGGSNPATLTVAEYYDAHGEWGTWVYYTAKERTGSVSQILAYDLAGRRIAVGDAGDAFSSAGVDVILNIPGKMPRDISAVTVGEKPREKTFHDITVSYPGRVEYKYMQYLDAMAKRLGIDAEEVYHGFYLLRNEPMKTIDLVRGRDVGAAWDQLQETRLSDNAPPLTEEETAKLEEAARAWSAADDIDIRCTGLELGVRIGSREFIDRALAALKSYDAPFHKRLASGLCRQSEKLTPADVAAIRELIVGRKMPEVDGALVSCLVACPLPEATDVLVELAKRDDSLLWWRPLKSQKVFAALGVKDAIPPPEWPLDLKARLFISSDFKRPQAHEPEVAERAGHLLPALVTNECRNADSEAFMACLVLTAKECDRGAATSAMIDYLRRLDSYEGAGESIDFIVRCLNRWNGVDIAGLGSDADSNQANLPLRNWRRVAVDALQWRDTGRVRPDVPDGYRAREGDLRIALYEKGHVDNAAIGLWINEESPAAIGIPQTVLCSDAVLTFSIEPAPPMGQMPYSILRRSRPDYTLTYSLQTGLRQKAYDGCFDKSQLPEELECSDDWVVTVDNALAPDPVLGNTAAFRKWWATFGPPPPPDKSDSAPPAAN